MASAEPRTSNWMCKAPRLARKDGSFARKENKLARKVRILADLARNSASPSTKRRAQGSEPCLQAKKLCAQGSELCAQSKKPWPAKKSALHPEKNTLRATLDQPKAEQAAPGAPYHPAQRTHAHHQRGEKGLSLPPAGRLEGAEKRSGEVGARSALQHLTRRRCLSAAPTGREASSAAPPRREHRRAVLPQAGPPERSPDGGRLSPRPALPRQSAQTSPLRIA